MLGQIPQNPLSGDLGGTSWVWEVWGAPLCCARGCPQLCSGGYSGRCAGNRLGWGETVPAREQRPTHPLSSASSFQNKLFTLFFFLPFFNFFFSFLIIVGFELPAVLLYRAWRNVFLSSHAPAGGSPGDAWASRAVLLCQVRCCTPGFGRAGGCALGEVQG